MIPTTEELSHVAQLLAARDAEMWDANAARLSAWQRRYPHDVIQVPAVTQQPHWPAQRSSIPARGNITTLKTKAAAR